MASPTTLPQLIYFHGQPGGPGEFQACAPPGLRAFTPDRTMPVAVSELAALIVSHCADGPVTLIGFSLGAPVALAVARAKGDRVAHLHLIAPAAPLALGDFLPAMAGGSLFRLARSRPALFWLVAQLESLVARTAPGFLCDRLFATAAGADLALSRDPGFRQAMAQVLRAGLGRSPAGFIAEVTAYAAGGPADLAGIAVPITLWQGDADNWTPPAMAEALAAALPGSISFNRLPGCSHYAALRAALARL